MQPRDGSAARSSDEFVIEGSRIKLPPEQGEPWRLVERFVEHYPDDWRLVFRRDEQVLEVSVPQEVWRAFDA